MHIDQFDQFNCLIIQFILHGEIIFENYFAIGTLFEIVLRFGSHFQVKKI